jgi:META domain
MIKKQNIKSGSLLLLLAVIAAFSGCASSDHSSNGSDGDKISAEELQNTIWLSPICGMPSEGQYGNEGFFLAEDGSVLFVNIFSMTGDSWTLDGNDLKIYSHTERYPDPNPVNYPLIKTDGIARISPVDGENEMIQPSAQKIIPQIPEGRWLISTMLNPESAAADPEHPAYMVVVKNEDGSVAVQGNGSVNNYRAVLKFDDFSWETGPLMRTLMAGPALEYEDLFMKNLDRINHYLYLDDFLFLYHESELLLVMQKDQS